MIRGSYKPKPQPVFERFWSYVIAEGDCWLWTASKNRNGYGQFNAVNSRPVLAHRLSYRWFKGPIPVWLELDHLCRTRACVNPAHLEAVTHQTNSRRSIKEQCPKGHPYVGPNLYIYKLGNWRRCRTCHREGARRYRERARAYA